MSDPVLQVRNFTVEFWVDGSWYPAAVDMNFDVQAGKTLAIVGESGSGKSTTAMGIMDLLASNARMSGSVKVKGSEMIGVAKSQLRKFRGREVAYIFQEPMTALNPVYTIGFQIVETLRTHFDMGPKAAKARAIELITLVEIPNPELSFDKYPHQLSGGQRQRIAIARAIIADPRVLVLDDATSAVDPSKEGEIREAMRTVMSGRTTIVIAHRPGTIALALTGKEIGIKDGNQVAVLVFNLISSNIFMVGVNVFNFFKSKAVQLAGYGKGAV